MKTQTKALTVLFFFVFGATKAQEFNIVDFGAVSSHTTLSTQSIQAAIDAAHDNDGGTVLIPKGIYTTGTLFLKSNVTIKLEANAKIYGSSSFADYAEVPIATEEPQFTKCLFYAKGVENIAFIGHERAEINGRGYFFKHNGQRPKLFRIEESKNISFREMIIKNSGSWCMYFRESDNINFYKTALYNKENQNNDGMNFDGCSNVTIRDCNLQVEDDAICLKSSVDKINENFLIENCTISSYWASIKFGTASKSGFKNIKVRNCQFFDSRRGAIKLLAVDGAIIEDVEFSNIKMYNCGGPIFIRLGNRGRDYTKSIRQIYKPDANPEGRAVGKIRNIRFKNIEARLTGQFDPPTEGIMFTGLPGHYIENVTMENIHFSYTGFGTVSELDRVVPEDEARYPEQLFFGVLPSYGMYLRHVKGLKIKNMTMSLRSSDNRPAVVMDDVVNSDFEDINYDITPKADAGIVLANVKNVVLRNISTSEKEPHIFHLKGKNNNKIRLPEGTKADGTSVKFSNGATAKSLMLKR